MKVVVAYESMFGNTAAVGEVIAGSLRSQGLDVLSGPLLALDPSSLGEADLVVIGGPTHAHGMSSKGTRTAAVGDKRYPASRPKDPGPGLRDWLGEIPDGAGRLAATFDTRFDKPAWITGSAAKGIAKRLEHRGYRLLVSPESFFVDGEHQLEPGQLDRAAAWAAQLAERASAGVSP